MARSYEDLISRHARGDLVDLGCGNAPLAGIYGPLVDTVVWADWPNSPHTEIQLDQGVDLNQPLPFGDQSFDTIILSDVLEHIARPQSLLAEINRVLRPGGRLIAGVPYMYHLHEEPFDYYRYTKYAIRFMAEEAGLEAEEIHQPSGGVDVLFDVFGKLTYHSKVKAASVCVYLLYKLIGPVAHRLTRKRYEQMPLSYTFILRKPA